MPLHSDDPKSIGGYRLLDRLGAGGMGVVYRGRARSGRDVAIKVVHAQYAADPVFRTRFRQEIAAVRKVSGAFTAPVLDADPEAALPWMATQYVPGPSLARRIRDRGALPDAEVRGLALGLVEALRDIHRAGVVHRDLKPANVLLAEDGPRVIDFGISRAAENHQTLTETGQMIGTPPFMSPEQLVDARTVGPASDVFSLGSLLVYAVTGRGPFDADSPYLTAYRVVHDVPVLEGVGQPLRELLERCLSKDAADRPGLDELSRGFATALPGPEADDASTVLLRRDRPGPRPGPADTSAPARRGRPWPLPAAIGTVATLVLGLTAYSLIGPGQAGGGSPEAWRPWQTTVYESAARGAKQALDGADGADSGPVCQVSEDAVYCGGDRILPVRLDGRTGRTVWRADVAPSGTGEGAYSSTVLGVRDDTVLVRQVSSRGSLGHDLTSVVALDATTGERLWSRAVRDTHAAPVMVGDLVVLPDGGSGRTLTARSPRTGTERWTAPLPKDHSCGLTPAGGSLYLECFSESQGDRQDSVIVALDPADGSTRRLTAPADDTDLLGAYDGQLVFLRESSTQAPGGETAYDEIVLMDATGSLTLTRPAERLHGDATLAGGTLWFTSSGGEVTAVSPASGSARWKTRSSVGQPGPAAYDARTRTVYVAGADGRMAALDARKGTPLWQTPPRAGREPSAAENGPEVLVSGRTLILATPGGGVFSIDPADPERTAVPG
ncbi:serine/threonine-protein kinase [Streptomyces sp. HP-A2021]|uniref:serine/threonine-protein kinase n=1 Tax=Streptomyces sp. HP-A2021 TaxID=2927875 RepID=UPI001FAF28E4|nr:serine/threonine-protein kinase [Streptomyces sp. HP-A2021]UOB13432.1 serine/threonine-protein kinase [Streptomyces sp. HP-A2021]